MVYALIFLIIGIAVGLLAPMHLISFSSFYISVGILAAIDSIIGALRASYEDDFDFSIFISGLLINTFLAVLLSYLGDKLGVPLYYAAVFVFGTRVFNNLAKIRRSIITRVRTRRQEKRALEREAEAREAEARALEEKRLEEEAEARDREFRRAEAEAIEARERELEAREAKEAEGGEPRA